MDDLRVNQATIARIFGKDVRTIQRWGAEGFPRIGEGPATTYDVPACVAWAIERERAAAVPLHADYNQALAEKTAAQAELAQMEVAKLRGELVALEDIKPLVRGPLEQVDAALRNAPARYAADLAAAAKLKDGLRRAQRILGDIIERIRDDLRKLADDGDGPQLLSP